MRPNILACLAFSITASVSGAQTLTANWDAFNEGDSGLTLTDGSITVANLDRALGAGFTGTFVIERADGNLAGLPGFTPNNALGFGGYSPGAGVGFSRCKSFDIQWVGGPATSAQVEMYDFASYAGNTCTLEALSGASVVASNSFTFSGAFVVTHHTLAVTGVSFDALRVVGGGAQDSGVFFAVADSIQITSTPPPAGVSQCFGDDTGTSCPCSNDSPVGANEGCESSLGFGGRLRSIGISSIASDSAVLQGSQMPNSSALYYQGTGLVAGGAGSLFGDGLRCVNGTIIRLGTQTNASGSSQYPAAGDPSISVRGLVATPGVRYYQVWYRNAAAFCTASTFNLTNSHELTWVP
jgi:hypothetical protein